MRPLLVLFVLPVVCGVIFAVLFQSVRKASFAAAVCAPGLVFALVKLSDPNEPWSAFATFLMSPVVIAFALIAVFLCSGRPRLSVRRRCNGGGRENAGVQ
jgi:fumarate reductase subunit C